MAILTRGHPSYKATFSENIPCIIVSNIPLTRGHPSNKARFSIPQGWPYKRGTTVHIYIIYIYMYIYIYIYIYIYLYTYIYTQTAQEIILGIVGGGGELGLITIPTPPTSLKPVIDLLGHYI